MLVMSPLSLAHKVEAPTRKFILFRLNVFLNYISN